jgi:hypothetical protein
MTETCRITYWQQETAESGRWLVTETMPTKVAELLIEQRAYERAEIIKECLGCGDVHNP